LAIIPMFFQGCACLHISSTCSRMLSLYAKHLLVGGLCKKRRRGKPSFTHFSLVPNSASAFRNLIPLYIIPRTWLWMTVQHTRPLFATAYSTLDVMFLRQTKETNRTPCQCTESQTVLQVASHIWVLCDITVPPRPVSIHASCAICGSEWV